MKVLFIGGTGLISTACTQLAADRGIELYLFNRGQRPATLPAGVKVIPGDIRKPDEAARALAGHTFDSVTNWIAFTPEHIETDLRLFAGKTGQYIFISSASAYQKPVTDFRITESTPLCNPWWEYSRNKIACEERLMAEYRKNGFPMTIVRPSHTYGDPMFPFAVGPWGKPWSLVDRIRRGLPVVVHGDGTSLWVSTHNTDFAKAFTGLLGHQQSIGHAFHITSDEVLNWDQHYAAIGRAVGMEPKIVHIASDAIVRAFPEESGGLLGDKTWSVAFDNTKIKRFVPDYVATTPLVEGVQQSIDWLSKDPSRQGIDEAFNQKTEKLIAQYGS